MSPNVRFRPRVEECEPRLLPDASGVWHALIQSGKEFIGHYKAAKGLSQPDPFCDGTEPGPCADLDAQILREKLRYARGDIAGHLADTLDEIDAVRQRLVNLPHDPGWEGLAVRYQLYLSYLDARRYRESLDLNDMDALLRNSDERLRDGAKSLSDDWWGAGFQADLRHMKESKKIYDDAIRQRLSTDRILEADLRLAGNQGKVDADIEDSLILAYWIEQAR